MLEALGVVINLPPAARARLAEETGIGKLSITIAPVDVPTDKKGLIAFLNGLPSAKAP